MYYEINVAQYGHHLFATAERSVSNIWELEKIYNLFKEKFPKSEGYEISVTKWEKCGQFINMEEA